MNSSSIQNWNDSTWKNLAKYFFLINALSFFYYEVMIMAMTITTIGIVIMMIIIIIIF